MSTERTRPIQGYKEPESTKKENPVDPEKFQQELLKVSESDESNKRHQRNLKKQEEGEADEDNVLSKPTPTANAESFSAFMGHGENNDSAFAVKDPQNVKTIQTTASGSAFTLDDEDVHNRITQGPISTAPTSETFAPETPSALATPEASMASRQAASTPLASKTALSQTPSSVDIEAPSEGFAITEGSLSSQGTSSDEEQAGFQNDNKQPPSTKDTTSSQATSKPKDQSLYARKGPSLAHKQKKPSSSAELKIESSPKTTLSEPLETKPSQQTTKKTETQETSEEAKQATKRPEPIEKPLPQEIPQNILGQAGTTSLRPKQPSSAPSQQALEAPEDIIPSEKTLVRSKADAGESSTGKDSKKDHKGQNKEDLSQQVVSMTPVVPFEAIPSVTPPPPSAYSSLPPQLMELFDKMIGLITVQQGTGITTTTVTLNMPNSVFNGAQIVLDHYATAPNSFNVQLIGSPKAIDLFNNRMADLVAALEQNKQSYEVNLQRPILLEEYRSFKRKEKASSDEGKKDRRSK